MHTPENPTSQWSILNPSTLQWEEYPLHRITEILNDAHESLGTNVTAEPISVRVLSPYCVDMQVVDLPGFREFSLDNSKELLSQKIQQLNLSFMENPKNFMICVEEAGDAANMSSLMKCKQLDPSFERTVLIRNKLDKYYNDLTPENANPWLEGFGDLPPSLVTFTLTLPHWVDRDKSGRKLPPPMKFSSLRDKMSRQDVSELAARQVSAGNLSKIGFQNFATYMEKRIEALFSASISPLTKKLAGVLQEQQTLRQQLEEEIVDTNPESVSTTIRDCGMSFAHALNHVMEGVVSSQVKRYTLQEELELFHRHSSLSSSSSPTPLVSSPSSLPLELFPCEQLASVPLYIDYLRNVTSLPSLDMSINGGAMYRRLLLEVEIFLRFAEISSPPSKQDVVQAKGVAMTQLTWRDVIVKLLSNQTHLPMKRRIRYVGERLKFFFLLQKEVTLDFMSRVKGSPDEHMFSALYTKHFGVMCHNDLIKSLVFDTYDVVVERQMGIFVDLFHSMMSSCFGNPWVFLKSGERRVERGEEGEREERRERREREEGEEGDREEGGEVMFEETCLRIPWEMESRGGMERVVTRWIQEIPNEGMLIDEAVEKVKRLIGLTFGCIRSQLADQMELYAEAFFKLPMMRKMEEDMNAIDLEDLDKEMYRERRQILKGRLMETKERERLIQECLNKLVKFAASHRI